MGLGKKFWRWEIIGFSRERSFCLFRSFNGSNTLETFGQYTLFPFLLFRCLIFVDFMFLLIVFEDFNIVICFIIIRLLFFYF